MTYYKKIRTYTKDMLVNEIQITNEILKIEDDKRLRNKLNLLKKEYVRRQKLID